jgi:hypothetical protein
LFQLVLNHQTSHDGLHLEVILLCGLIGHRLINRMPTVVERPSMFYPRNTPSMIVNNIPSSTVVQMAAFQFGDRPVWVEDCHRPLCDSRYGKLHAGKWPFIRDGARFALRLARLDKSRLG